MRIYREIGITQKNTNKKPKKTQSERNQLNIFLFSCGDYQRDYQPPDQNVKKMNKNYLVYRQGGKSIFYFNIFLLLLNFILSPLLPSHSYLSLSKIATFHKNHLFYSFSYAPISFSILSVFFRIKNNPPFLIDY